MFWFFNSFAVLFILIGRHRSKWLWFPALLLGLYLFWVMIAWNRVPSFSDSISISASERGIKDSIGVDVLVKHPYFGFRNFSDDIWDFCFGYGQSNVGVSAVSYCITAAFVTFIIKLFCKTAIMTSQTIQRF